MSESKHLRDLVQQRFSRRNFLRGLGVLGAGVAAGATLPGKVASAAAASAAAAAVGGVAGAAATVKGVPFTPIEPSSADDLVLPEGYSYQVIIKRGDVFTKDGKTFGDNCDWTGWYAIDWLTGGNSTTEGLLCINNEYFNSLFVSRYTGEGDKTPEQVQMEKEAVGFAIVHIKKVDGKWTVVTDSDYAKRIDATVEIDLVGPVAGSAVVKGATKVVGTLANCSGGQTPWYTALSCEENYQDYYGEDSVNEVKNTAYNWQKVPNAQPPEHYGWVVEIDPYTGKAKKLTGMGRFRHENVAIGIGKSGKVVAYMGDDKRDECVYKFISEKAYTPNNREANMDILDKGTLYVADFGRGRWIPVVWEGNEKVLGDPAKVGGYTITDQAGVLTYCAQAARALGGTRTDRPEDIEISPTTGEVYIAFTNNSSHGNFHGQITRIKEAGGDWEALTFDWDIFAVGGPQSGFSSPDNLVFDADGDLWMVSDISSGSLNKGIYKFHGNNAAFMFITDPTNPNFGKGFRFASGPVECEMTGPTWITRNELVLAIQHPGEETPSLTEFTSNWPANDGKSEPRAGVVIVTGPFDKKA